MHQLQLMSITCKLCEIPVLVWLIQRADLAFAPAGAPEALI